MKAYPVSPDVEFCGYSIPHPSEELMNIRIQTYGTSPIHWITAGTADDIDGTTAVEALEKGFDDLMDMCDIVADKFANAREDFTSGQMQE